MTHRDRKAEAAPGGAADDPLLQFPPQAPRPSAPDVPSHVQPKRPYQEPGLPPPPRPRDQRRPAAEPTVPPARADNRRRSKSGEQLAAAGYMNGMTERIVRTRERSARGPFWLATFVGGVAVGALAMWLLGIGDQQTHSVTDVPKPSPAASQPAALGPALAASDATARTEASPTAPASPPGLDPTAGAGTHSEPTPRSSTANNEPTAAAQPPTVDAAPPRGGAPVPVTGPEAANRPSTQRAAEPPRVRATTSQARTQRTDRAAAGTSTRGSSFKGSIAVQSQPAGATVFMNGRSVGSTPVVLNELPIGSRALRIEAPGYQRWSASVQVTADQQTLVAAQLQRSR